MERETSQEKHYLDKPDLWYPTVVESSFTHLRNPGGEVTRYMITTLKNEGYKYNMQPTLFVYEGNQGIPGNKVSQDLIKKHKSLLEAVQSLAEYNKKEIADKITRCAFSKNGIKVVTLSVDARRCDETLSALQSHIAEARLAIMSHFPLSLLNEDSFEKIIERKPKTKPAFPSPKEYEPLDTTAEEIIRQQTDQITPLPEHIQQPVTDESKQDVIRKCFELSKAMQSSFPRK